MRASRQRGRSVEARPLGAPGRRWARPPGAAGSVVPGAESRLRAPTEGGTGLIT